MRSRSQGDKPYKELGSQLQAEPCGPTECPNPTRTLADARDRKNPNSIHIPVEPGDNREDPDIHVFSPAWAGSEAGAPKQLSGGCLGLAGGAGNARDIGHDDGPFHQKHQFHGQAGRIVGAGGLGQLPEVGLD